MILFRPGSHLDFLVTLLSIVGEYPVQSVSLLGNERVMKALIHDLALPQSFHNSITGEKFSGRILRQVTEQNHSPLQIRPSPARLGRD